MSQEQTPNTPKANTTNHTTTDHISTPTSAQGAPPPLFSGRLSPSSNPDFPRRSSSLQPSSPGAPSSKTTDTSVDQPSDSMGDANAGEGVQVGNVLSSEEQRLDGSGENNMENAKEKIEEFDWDGLEERFWGKMEECRRVEERIMGEFGELIEVFNAWTTAGAVGEEERAGKRLRTRMTFVQQKEKSLEEKRLHYVKVVKAFESVLALLSGA
ncbi:MAG: hypothetical protein ASARMPREDX12_006005 [Alectoria sarmentosa]|nr:MAG: hypothetical protein ASARMPREDX12_006005 [Alectoria sarmentosa]